MLLSTPSPTSNLAVTGVSGAVENRLRGRSKLRNTRGWTRADDLPLAAGRRCFQAHLAEFQAHLAEVYGAGVGVVARVKPRVLANEAVGGPCFWRDVARRQVTRAGNGIVTERVREEGGRVRPGWRCGVVGG
jgi:hypothetical protein